MPFEEQQFKSWAKNVKMKVLWGQVKTKLYFIFLKKLKRSLNASK